VVGQKKTRGWLEKIREKDKIRNSRISPVGEGDTNPLRLGGRGAEVAWPSQEKKLKKSLTNHTDNKGGLGNARTTVGKKGGVELGEHEVEEAGRPRGGIDHVYLKLQWGGVAL